MHEYDECRALSKVELLQCGERTKNMRNRKFFHPGWTKRERERVIYIHWTVGERAAAAAAEAALSIIFNISQHGGLGGGRRRGLQG